MTDTLDDEQRGKHGLCLFRGFSPLSAPALPSQALTFFLSFFVIAPCVLKLSPTPSPSLSPPSFCVDYYLFFRMSKKKKKDVSATIATSVQFKEQSFDDGK